MKYGKIQALVDQGKLVMKNFGPELKLGYGIGLIFGGFALAITGTKAYSDEIAEAEQQIIDVHNNKEEIKFHKSDAEYYRSVCKAYKDYVWINAKAYGAGLAALILGTGFIVSSHKDVREKQFEQAAVAGALAKELTGVYSKIEEKYGKEEADKLRLGIEDKEVEVEEDGKVVKKTVSVVSPDYNGFYTYKWKKDSSTYKTNKMLREAMREQIEAYLNQMLTIRYDISKSNPRMGWLFLSEALQAFDLDPADEGQDVGWIYLPGGNVVGDNRVDVSMVDAWETNPATGKLEEITLLTFNVDGNIRPRIFPRPR